MVKTAILVSGGGANLQAIIDAKIFGDLKECEITAVISSTPDVYALKRAEFAEIPAYVVDISIFPNRASFTEAIIKKLIDLDIELVVLAGFKYYLEIQFFRTFKNRIIITQPSLMPAFSGECQTNYTVCMNTLAAGVRISGATTYLVTDNPSNGPIILQKAIDVKKGDDVVSLEQRIMEEAEWKILPASISLFCENRLELKDDNTLEIKD